MKITKKDVLEIAVAYQAYCAADSDNAVAVWGRFLMHRQCKTGVELVPAAMLAARVEAAQARVNAIFEEAAAERLAIDLAADDYAAEEASEAAFFSRA